MNTYFINFIAVFALKFFYLQGNTFEVCYKNLFNQAELIVIEFTSPVKANPSHIKIKAIAQFTKDDQTLESEIESLYYFEERVNPCQPTFFVSHNQHVGQKGNFRFYLYNDRGQDDFAYFNMTILRPVNSNLFLLKNIDENIVLKIKIMNNNIRPLPLQSSTNEDIFWASVSGHTNHRRCFALYKNSSISIFPVTFLKTIQIPFFIVGAILKAYSTHDINFDTIPTFNKKMKAWFISCPTNSRITDMRFITDPSTLAIQFYLQSHDENLFGETIFVNNGRLSYQEIYTARIGVSNIRTFDPNNCIHNKKNIYLFNTTLNTRSCRLNGKNANIFEQMYGNNLLHKYGYGDAIHADLREVVVWRKLSESGMNVCIPFS